MKIFCHTKFNHPIWPGGYCNQYTITLKGSSLKTLSKTSSVKFKTFINQLLATKQNPKNIAEIKYLRRPSHEELVYWYVVRELHYNNSEPDSLKKAQNEIIDCVLKDTVDERWLLDNYFYRISHRLGVLFNDADLSSRDFQIDKLGYKNETEKAMFFMFMINSCGQRLSVMNFTGKSDPKSVIRRLPKLNGKDYYYFKDFDYPDFKWIGHKKIESYNERHIGIYYEVLLNHFHILIDNGLNQEAKHLVQNSILSVPGLFKYSGLVKSLNELYEQWK